MTHHNIKPLDDILDEQFFNPFDSEHIQKDSKPKHISDRGGLLGLRKEIFNINRVEYTRKENGGYQVIAKTQISKGEIVEIAPVIFLDNTAKSVNTLKDYIFEIDKEKATYCICLGYGSLYSHSKDPNIEFAYNKSNKQMYFIAKKFIQVGEVLNINYGDSYWAERMNFNLVGGQNNQAIVPQVTDESEVVPNTTDVIGTLPLEDGSSVNKTQTNFNNSPDNINLNLNPAQGSGPILGGDS